MANNGQVGNRATNNGRGRRIAIIIGTNEYLNMEKLEFAESDAKEMGEVLLDQNICGFDEKIELIDKTKEEVSHRIEKVFKDAKKDDEILIYFSGHGKPSYKFDLCLLFKDTDPESLLATSLKFDYINECKDQSACNRVVVILDCCYSGTAGMKGDFLQETLSKYSGSGTILLTSTGQLGSNIAKEDKELKHGVFTHYLLKGLRDWAADYDDNGIITVDDLYRYTFSETKDKGLQRPQKKGSYEGEMVLGRNPQKIRDREFEQKEEKLMQYLNPAPYHFVLYKSLTALQKMYNNPSALEPLEVKIKPHLESLLNDELQVEAYVEIVKYQEKLWKQQEEEQKQKERLEREKREKKNQEMLRKQREEELQRQREEEERKKEKEFLERQQFEEQERKQREEEKARKEREEQKRKEEEERKNLSAVKKPIESGSKTAYERPMEDEDWNLLLQRIKDGKCTPFLGAGASCEKIPLGSQIAIEWAKKYGYPMEDSDNLARVAQFVAVTADAMTPKEEMCKTINELLKEVAPSYFEIPDELHGVLAELPLPVYITTNYDDLMVQALKSRGKTPIQEICRWNKSLMQRKRASPDFVPTPEKPLVYHLHGYYEIPESLVLTEDDYQDFLVAISRDIDLLPPRIQQAFTDSSFLFLGYRIDDWDFRVLLRILAGYLKRRRRKHLSVQFMPGYVSETQKEEAQKYLDRYFDELDIQVYWQDCREFAKELRTRWEAFNGGI